MLRPGNYRAITAMAIEFCRRNGEFTEPAVLDYVSYEPGEEFEIPRTVNNFFYRVQEDSFHEEPAGRWERIETEAAR